MGRIPAPPYVAILVWLGLLLSSAAAAVFDSGGRSSGGGAGSPSSTFEWQILTKGNFSSQIRLHPHILLMVTVPWSGESRSLMKEIKYLVTANEQRFGYLRLMIIHRNSEKILADVIGAAEGIKFIYYHHSKPFKYHGRLRAQNILSSVYHIMSLKHEEVPLKPLHTPEDLHFFLQSTDKSVLLLEFCGWSAKLAPTNNESFKISSKNHSYNAHTGGDVLTTETYGFPEFLNINKKVDENEELTYASEGQVTGSPWKGKFAPANHSKLEQGDNIDPGTAMLCTTEEFHKFESFYKMFLSMARENFLPPERQRFGLVSTRSLLPSLGIGNVETWLLMISYSGCPNCLTFIKEGDDLRAMLQMHHHLIEELDLDGYNSNAAFPVNRPSIILFIDRSSESSKVKEESKSSLAVLRQYVCHNQLPYQMAGVHSCNSGSHMAQAPSRTKHRVISDATSHQTSVDSKVTKVMKIKDNMAIMIVNDGETISVKNSAQNSGGNPLYDVLMQLLQQTKLAHTKKENRLSLLAKEVGFQLLSDDLEVQEADSLPDHEGDGQLSDTPKITVISGHDINEQADIAPADGRQVAEPTDMDIDLTSKIHNETSAGNINRCDGDLMNGTCTIEEDEGKRSEQVDHQLDIQQIKEEVFPNGHDDNELADTSPKIVKIGINAFKSIQPNDRTGLHEEGESRLSTWKGELLSPMEQEPQSFIEDLMMNQVDNMNDSTGESAEHSKSMTVNISDGLHDNSQSFVASFFFSDGGFHLLRALTGGSKFPSLVILDPLLQQHHVLPEETDITYDSIVNFLEEYRNQSLAPYQRSASPTKTSKEFPRPPFVNLDFREANPVPRVTANTFCDLVIGSRSCKFKNVESVLGIENFRSPWKTDVLVLFTNSWCGFCQRMELVVREVYRTFNSFMILSKSQADRQKVEDSSNGLPPDGLPSIYLMDCTLNDCYPFFKSAGKEEHYPTLLLFPAENKTAISYEGSMSVINICEFLEHHGRNSHLLNHKGFLWDKNRARRGDAYLTVPVDRHDNINKLIEGESDRHVDLATMESDLEETQFFVGCILTATDKLVNAAPFDNSAVLIVSADPREGFQGLITNKRISWDIFKDPTNSTGPLRRAPLFYGGPVRLHNLPLVSLARKVVEGYIKVVADVYFGNPVVTSMAIERIKSGDLSANDFWFFLGYSSWAHNQLFDELREGVWHVSDMPVEHLDWPQS